MKYEAPKYDLCILESEDVLMSNEVQMEQTSDNTADFIITASSLFRS